MTRIGAFVFLLTASGVAVAQSDRAGAWEIGFGVSSASSEELLGPDGSSAFVDSGIGFGAVVGYNFTDRIALLAEASWVAPDYIARLPADGPSPIESVDAELLGDTWHVKSVFYFSRTAFSPYVEFGAGWTRIDSNIAADEPSADCWWDPWAGTVCTSFEYDDTRTSYSTAFGVRWDMNGDTALKVSWGQFRLDAGAQTEGLRQDVFRADFSWKF